MMISTPHLTQTPPCSCESDRCCHEGSLEHPRYFPRQMITATELTLEHDYERDRSRRHNRMLHGWGVVCGAEVCLVSGTDGVAVPWKVVIKPGYILSSCGDEIIIDCERIVDVRTNGVMCMSGAPPGEVSDPWCSDERTDRAGTVCIAVQYREFMSRPVQVHPVGCGCGGTDCEYSRWRDGYEVGLLPDCPDRHRAPGPPRQLPAGYSPGTADEHDAVRALVPAGAALNRTEDFGLFECPPCPTDPWVVLACVDVNGKGAITAIDNCSCRRLAFTAARFSWHCVEESTEVRQLEQASPGPVPSPPEPAAARPVAAPPLAPRPASPARAAVPQAEATKPGPAAVKSGAPAGRRAPARRRRSNP